MSTRKNIVITGGARGIGRVTGRHLASLGHNVFLIDINEPELVYTATEHIPKFLAEKAAVEARDAETGSTPRVPVKGGLIGYQTCDLRDQAAIRSTIHYAATSFFPGGHIDVLVNNAGIARAQFRDGRAMDNHGPEIGDDWAAYLATNLTAPFLVSQACIPYMKSRCIINISSFRSKQSEPNCEGYAASKAGLLGLTQAMSISGAQWGIRCNAILPGFTFVDHECREADETPEKMWWTKDIDGARHRHHPVGRIGYGEDIAQAIVWLMSAGFVTGQEIVVDGGINRVKHESA
ncbi:short chain dehydrogenase [Coniella lustricola]|uniref:Short chain dehydrogenase n=1 Tax=Coniella lustricola TaxID=2025994 RepID=A0A2T3AH87_9PEZI|nr:short chain dehydrogenase [Coniella lustricola]